MLDVISSRKSPKEKTCYLKGHGSGRFCSFFEIQSDWQDQRKVWISTLKTGSRNPHLTSAIKTGHLHIKQKPKKSKNN